MHPCSNVVSNAKLRKTQIRDKDTTSSHLDWSVHVWLFNTQHNLPGNSDSVEEVVDEADVVDESVHVTGAQHKQGGQALQKKKKKRPETDC